MCSSVPFLITRLIWHWGREDRRFLLSVQKMANIGRLSNSKSHPDGESGRTRTLVAPLQPDGVLQGPGAAAGRGDAVGGPPAPRTLQPTERRGAR